MGRLTILVPRDHPFRDTAAPVILAKLPCMPSPAPWTCVVFDLDGTLIDSASGVISSVEAAFRAEGILPPHRSELRKWLGPPMIDNLRSLPSLHEAEVARIHARYRIDYDTRGVLTSEPFTGSQHLIDLLMNAGIACGVATSKPQAPASLIVAHLGWESAFLSVAGADPARPTKTACIRACLTEMAERGADTSRPVVVGDRSHDVRGAQECGVDAIYVTWGYGSVSESAGATLLADTFESLGRYLAVGAASA